MTRDDYVRASSRRRPAAPDLPGDRRERPRSRHRVPVLAHQAHTQHHPCRTGCPLGRQAGASGGSRRHVVKAYFEEGLDTGDMSVLIDCAVRAGIDGIQAQRSSP